MNEFLKIFENVAKRHGIAEGDHSKAKDAVKDIYNFAKPTLKHANAFMPFFADHGATHVHNLAKKLSEIPAEMLNDGHILKDIDALVILFSAIILHDIGMGVLLDVENKEHEWCHIEELWKEQGMRYAHDHKSLMHIEQHLMKPFDTEYFLGNWKTYWNNSSKNKKLFPEDHGKYALITTTRVCQAHGDPGSTWLDSEQLKRYSIKDRSLFDNERAFGDYFTEYEIILGSNIEEGTNRSRYLDILIGCSALISLLDLTDISSDRFDVPSMAADSYTMPEKRDKKGQLFYHWSGNKLTSTKFEDKRVICLIAPPTVRSKCKLLQFYTGFGPGSTLVEWGNKKALIDGLKIGGIEYRGVEAKPATDSPTKWSEVLPCATARFSFFSLLELAVLNKPDNEMLIHKLWLTCLYKPLLSDIKRIDKAIGHGGLFNAILTLLADHNLFIDKTYISTKPHLDRKIVIISQDSSSPPDVNEHLFPLELLLSAIKVATEIANTSLSSNRSLKLRFTMKSDGLFKDLTDKDEISNHKDEVILVYLGNNFQLHECKKMVDVSKELLSNSPYLLFFGEKSAITELQSSKPEIPFVGSNKSAALCELKNNGTLIANILFDGQAVPATITASTPLLALHEIYKQCAGVSQITCRIKELLDSTSPDELKSGASLLLLMSLVELLSDSNKADIDNIKKCYAKLNSSCLSDIHLHANCQDVIAKLTTELDKNHITLNSNSMEVMGDVIAETIVSLCNQSQKALLTVLMAAYGLQASGLVVNVNSGIFSMNIPVIAIKPFVEMILDRNKDLAARIYVASGVLKTTLAQTPENLEYRIKFIDSLGERLHLNGNVMNSKHFREFIICYQIAYSILQNLVEHPESMKILLEKTRRYTFVELAFVEVYGSDITDGPRYESISNEFISIIGSHLRLLAAPLLDRLVATKIAIGYDVIFYYAFKKDKHNLLNLQDNYKKIGKAKHWEDFCFYLHQGRGNVTDDWREPYAIWKPYRTSFHDVIDAMQECRNGLLSRNPLDAGIRARMNELEEHFGKRGRKKKAQQLSQ